MLRQSARVVLQAERAGACAAAQAAFTREFGAPASHDHPTTPLSPIMPKVVALPRQVLGTALSLAGKAVVAVGTSGAVKNAISSFADKAIVGENMGKLEEMDVAFWAYWLSLAGYSNPAGFRKFADAAKHKVAQLEPQQVTDLVAALHRVNYHDQDLLNGVGANISANFTKYETEQLLQILAAFHDFGYYEQAVFDDIGDSIAYCNHYLAPVKASPVALATAFAVYAKANHERGDVFVTLARGFSEVGLAKLDEEQRKETVLTALRAFHAFQFWPEQTDALLAAAKGLSLSAEESKEVDKYQTLVEDAVGGELKVFKEGDDVDAVHWYGHHTQAPQSYQLYVFRDGLVPKDYSPASIRPMK